ncbi:hypothetical protein A0O28_0006970 [Trichoderma guizhouense]|uniref:Uncharacterized protein n=1 Tax=Trichoderma guizhouense TaxID=1491466 RepID=A0A1T3CHL9_9HYPO|nr:hypothetical protein A0O28_0006970 [Trichoderma guizhouense]
MPAQFRYPYGEEHFWDESRYDEILPETKGKQFPSDITFDNYNEHMAALTQCQVQDIMWVQKAAFEIAEIPLRAYFVPARDGPVDECKFFYAIVPLGKAFLEKYEEAWRRLTKDPLLTLNFWDDEQDENCVSLEFPDQVADYKLKVEATCAFLPNARPSNPIAYGIPGQKIANGQWVPIPVKVKFKMARHRALLRGNGFYDVLVPSADEFDQLADKLAKSSLDIGVTDKGELLLPKRLPVIDKSLGAS